MFDFQDNKSQKRYGWVKRGWHIARIHQPSLKNSRVGNQYIKIDFEIIQEEECRDILVPGFFNYNRNGKADPRFLDMGKAAGLRENYGDDLNSVFHDLLGKELKVHVVHRYKGGRRRERVDDFETLIKYSDEGEELPNEGGDLPF